MKPIKIKFPIQLSLMILTLLLGFSCEREIEFNGEISKPRLVLNGIVELDSNFRVTLEKSRFFLSNEDESNLFITSGAQIIVRDLTNGQTYELNASTDDEVYEFPFVVTENTRYEIEASYADFETISAETTTLSRVEINSVDTTWFSIDDDGWIQDKLRFEMSFSDPGNNDNYYMITVSSSQDFGEGEYFYPIWLSSKDPAVDNEGNTDVDGSVYETPQLTMLDDTFNGGSKTIVFEGYNPFVWEDPDVENKMKVQLYSMNAEVYKYFKSVRLYQQQDFFSEPVKVFSNILNGFGIFGFTSIDEVIFE